MKPPRPRADAVLAFAGGSACLLLGLLFMWRDRHNNDHGLRALAFASFFAALFFASFVAGRWLKRRRRQPAANAFDVAPPPPVPPPCQLFVVEDVFTIRGRGVAAAGFTADDYGRVRRAVKAGDCVELKRPDRSTLFATVLGIEYPPGSVWIGPKPPDVRHAILLADLAAADVPAGTELWTVDPSRLPDNRLPSATA